MSKRGAEVVAENGDQAYLKRQKMKHVSSVPAETIQSSRQLQVLLAFAQDNVRAKHGIQSFKSFLEHAKADQTTNSLNILKEYLTLQKPRDEEDKTAVYMDDIMQSWSFASQSNEESILSLIPATLTLLFKTISSAIDFKEYGILLARTLLKKRQLELFARSLTANKTKAFLISPSLCLLREIVTFDGGALATQFARVRDSSLKALARNLGTRHTGEGIESIDRPSIRTNSMLLFCACIKLFTPEARKELLLQRDIVSALTRDIDRDPPHLLRETLHIFKLHILQDDKLARDIKSRLLNPASLGRIVTLYNYDHVEAQESTPAQTIPTLVHEFLTTACTSNEKGVLYRQAGFYPKGIDPDTQDADNSGSYINLGLDSVEWFGRFNDKVPVRNTTLSEFIQTLRPWSNTKQAELLLAIFRAAPELVADYFLNKKSFSFEPKLTATWIGYSSFIFSTIGLPLPAHFGHKAKYARLPPPNTIILQSILPLPLNQKTLSKCIANAAPLIRLFGMRILILALEKLRVVLRFYKSAAKEFPIWEEASNRLVHDFSQRCPLIKDVLATFRAISPSDLIMRHAASKVLVLYYEVVPQVALEAMFDISTALTQVLGLLDESSLQPQDFAMRTIEAENMFQIAQYSPGMKWFKKADSRPISPFTSMLRLAVMAPANVPLSRIRSVLRLVIRENDILQEATSRSSLEALLIAARSITNSADSDTLYSFLDNCFSRCAQSPIKYIEALEKLQSPKEETDGKELPTSLLSLVIAEQWPFIVKAGEPSAMHTIATFMSHWYAAAQKVKEDKAVLKSLIKSCAEAASSHSGIVEILENSKKVKDSLEIPPQTTDLIDVPQIKSSEDVDEDETSDIYTLMSGYNPLSLEDNSALLRWTSKEVEETIEDNHASSLLPLLSSEYLATRKEALTNIQKLAAKLKSSTYEEKDQIWLLLLELSETAKASIEQERLPTILSAFAANAIDVLRNPLHVLYPKLNKFLTKGPTWDLDRIPLMHAILEESPSLDGAYYREVDCLFTNLMDGLRTPADMEIYRRRGVFERLLSFYNNAYAPDGVKQKVLKICYLATKIEGGSMTLVTRSSILSWLKAQADIAGHGQERNILLSLRSRVVETCDVGKLQAWAGMSVKDLMA